MNHKTSRFIKVAFSLLASFVIFVAIVFFIFIAPHRTIPILMYHSVSDSEVANNAISLGKDIFKWQMDFLKRHNYKVIPLRTVVSMLKQGIKIPDNWIALTFDDGYGDFYTNVYPIIKKHRFNTTVFVFIDKIEKNPDSLSWQQLRQLKDEGLVDIGSHAISHRPLVFLSSQEVKAEVLNSKLKLEKELNKSVIYFSYPFGAVDDSVREIVKGNSYEAAVGTSYRKGDFPANDIYILRRVFVSNFSKNPLVFRFMLSGYYVPTRELILQILNIKTPRDVWLNPLRRNPRGFKPRDE